MKRLGIIGGMGSVAAADTFQLLQTLQDAACDQDYLEVFLHNNARVPDRTAGILGEGPPALDELRRSVALCNRVGCDYLLLACMTSHHYLSELARESEAALIDGIAETVAHLRSAHPDAGRVGILATTGNLRVGLFQRALEETGLRPVVFDDADQRHFFMDPVYAPWGIKAGHLTGRPRERLRAAAARLVELGADAVIGGCSEVQTVLAPADVGVPLVNSIDILCRRAIELCGGRLRPAPAAAG